MQYNRFPYTIREITDEIYRCQRRTQIATIKLTMLIVMLLLIIFALLIERTRIPENTTPRPSAQQVKPTRPEEELAPVETRPDAMPSN